ncbi:hypothetical protein PIB30_042591 [Stylosanthes scabra]|uniref:Uncharacterized protein n=1 Tax=Stylosanthes scabra TaxID=79078 RepID=A0ABU6UHX5_9FABA|nr:hypothetical protein [Stylosanthes scabra]
MHHLGISTAILYRKAATSRATISSPVTSTKEEDAKIITLGVVTVTNDPIMFLALVSINNDHLGRSAIIINLFILSSLQEFGAPSSPTPLRYHHHQHHLRVFTTNFKPFLSFTQPRLSSSL